jgi:hypothetical protein
MCDLGWIWYCQCVHRALHWWSRWDKIVTTRPTGIAKQ